METKQCSKCSEVKAVSEFYRKGDGLRADCKSCVKARQKRYDDKPEHRERKAKSGKAYYLKNADSKRAYARAHGKATKEQRRERNAKRRNEINAADRARYAASSEVRVKALAKSRSRKIAQLQRTPPWADMSAIADFYVEAKRLEELTGIEFHVDHIVPLQGELVSGLHVAANLQLLPAHDNLSKSNSFSVAA